MTKLIFALRFAILFATCVYAQTEEPDWQDLNTHWLDSQGSKFPKEEADAVLKAILYDHKSPEQNPIRVTNLVELCSEADNKQCFAAALYTIDLSPNSMDEMQFLVWLDRMWISNDRFEYRRLWEYRTNAGYASGSLSVIDAPSTSFVTPCLLVKTSDNNNAYHGVNMRLFCLNRSNYPEILWEYNCDYTQESTGQAFRKSVVTFKDIDNDHVNDLVLDTVEGVMEGWEKGDSTFQITKHRTIFYYSDTVSKFLGAGLIPCQ